MNPPPAEGFASRLFAGPALRAQPDRRLVKLVREGYESAFEEIVRRYGKPLGRYAAGIVGSRSEDVTQDAFSKALVALRRDSEADIELRPWLYRIVRNTALNDLRDGPPTSIELAAGLEGGADSAAVEFERRQDLEELLERLQALPDPQRAAIVMRELEGLGHEEIAQSLGMSGGAARQAIFRARQALRDGVGLLVPLPILRLLLEHGTEAGIAAGAGGAALAAGAGGGAATAGTALKVGVVTAVLAGSVGTGLAIKDRAGDRDGGTAAAATVRQSGPQSATSAAGSGTETGSSAGDDGAGRGSSEPGDDSGGHGSGGDSGKSIDDSVDLDDGNSGSGSDDGPGHSGGSRHGGDDGGDPDRHGGKQPSGGGPGPSPGGGGSGSGHGGSGDGGQGSPVSGGSGPSQSPPPPPQDGSSGSGSGGDSGSSGSGSGDDFSESSGEGSESSGSGAEGSSVQAP